jgi:hypothetical protein
MQLRLCVLLSSAGLMLLSQAATASGISLVPIEEPVTTLVSPNAATIPSMHYDFTNGAPVATTVTSTPLLCANTSTPLVTGITLNPVYYSGTGIGATTHRPFVFGASSLTPNVSAQALGIPNVQMPTGTSMVFGGDATGSLVCYGLDASGARRLTRDIFLDGAEGVTYNSTVALSVFHTPDSGNPYYSYTIDVTVPALPANTNCTATGLDCNFVVEEGYDTAVFATNGGGWCLANAGATTCPGPTTAGDINMTIAAPIAPAAAKTFHFVVYRSFQTDVTSLPASGAPVALAALFSPNDLEENKLDDNVAAGNNQIANTAPSVAQDPTFTTFAGSLAGLNENTDSGTLTFDITDADTAETAGPALHAAVTLKLPGSLSVPVNADCSTLVPNSGGAPTPVNRVCTVDIPLNNASFWNSQVSATYDNSFNAVATDLTNGSYATGVSASASIIVTDSLGKTSAPQVVPVHIHSTANNAPVVAFGSGMPSAADSKQGGSSFPTYSCSIAANNCGATFHVVELDNLITALPGPAAAFDELASQSTAVLGLQCGLLGENSPLFVNTPVAVPTAGSLTAYDVLFQFTSPPVAGSSLCSLNITDSGAFPNGQTAKNTSSQFRVVVNL